MSRGDSKSDNKKGLPVPGHQVPSPAEEDVDGWFPPESLIRRISQEALVLFGGGARAILLQLAHPVVAAGVAEHSYFQSDPLARLRGTLDFIHAVVFGSRQEAEQSLRQLHQVHAPVQGRLPQAAGRFPAGSSYTASDPEARLWVQATLVDTALIAYERFVGPLTLDERRRYYGDTLYLARRLGIPGSILPPTLEDFQRYMADMLTGDTLAVTGTTRRLAWDVLDPPNVGIVPSASVRLVRLVTAGLLPERFRAAYGLAWDVKQHMLLEGLSRTTRWVRPWAPAWVWQSPHLKGRLARLLLQASTR
jgi:uncharacterized protein (DUF2236 family)